MIPLESKNYLPPTPLGWFFPDNSMLQPIFDKFFIQLFEEGVYNRIKQKIKPHQVDCPTENLAAVQFKFLIMIFASLALGILASLFIFIMEIKGLTDLIQTIVWP